MKKEITIFDEDNSILFEDEWARVNYDFYPEKKLMEIRVSVKNDVFYNYSTYEYKISTHPTEIHMRLLEAKHEPPEEYTVKDGVVLESEIRKNAGKFLNADEKISELKKEVEWSKTNLLGNYFSNLYLLTKHPDIISEDEYRRLLRQSVEALKMASLKIEEIVKNDPTGLVISEDEYGKTIWYPNDQIKDTTEYWDLSDEDKAKTDYGKKLAYVEKFNEKYFDPTSSSYVGVSKLDFQRTEELVTYLEKLLENKNAFKAPALETQLPQKSTHGKWWIVIILSIIALSWGVWTAIGVFFLGMIVINLISNK